MSGCTKNKRDCAATQSLWLVGNFNFGKCKFPTISVSDLMGLYKHSFKSNTDFSGLFKSHTHR